MIIIVKDLRVLEECSKLAAGWTAAVGKDGREGEGRGTTGGEGNDWKGGAGGPRHALDDRPRHCLTKLGNWGPTSSRRMQIEERG